MIVWRQVSCPYVLKFKGVFYHNDMPAIVTPWMPHGNITEYLEEHPEVDKLHLVSSNLLSSQAAVHPGILGLKLVGVVKAVNHLHGCNIAHGDIRAVSLLVFARGLVMTIILFPVEYSHFRYFSSQSNAHRHRFRPYTGPSNASDRRDWNA